MLHYLQNVQLLSIYYLFVLNAYIYIFFMCTYMYKIFQIGGHTS